MRCSFLDDDHQQGRATRQLSSLSPECPTDAQSQSAFANFEDQDAALMTHYTTLVYLSTTDDLDSLETWRSTVPSLALSFPYLRHGLLALSAMHVRLTSPPNLQSFYLDLARQHLDQALESYIPQLAATTEQSCPALFAFSVLLPALSLSFLQSVDTDLQGTGYVAEFVQTWNFLLGATAVAREARPWIASSPVSPLMTLRDMDNVLPCVAEGPRMALEGLLEQSERYGLQPLLPGDGQSAEAMPRTTSQGSVYNSSIELLSNAFPTNEGSPPQLAAVIAWPVFIDKEFFHLLGRGDPMALVILAYYGRALHGFSGFWWLQGLGSRLIQAVAQILGMGYYHLLQWPLQEVAIGT